MPVFYSIIEACASGLTYCFCVALPPRIVIGSKVVCFAFILSRLITSLILVGVCV